MKKRLIGIDLGTTNCCIAWMDGQEVVVYEDELERSTIPSIVAQTHEGEILVGWRAKNCDNPLYRHGFAKRGLGSSQKFPFKDSSVSAFEVSGLVLRELKRLAETKLNCEVAAVITVPAHFLAMHRDETQKAAQYAGLELIDLLPEPIAAAIAYYQEEANLHGANIPATETILVYDLGGGTMDATVCVRHGSHIEIGDFGKAYDGDKYLGGIDFDKALVAMAAAQLEKQEFTTSTIGDDLPSSQWLWELLSSAERCKQKLSDESEVQWTKELVNHDPPKRASLNFWVSRDRFEQSIAHLLDRTLSCCDQALITQVRKSTPANASKTRQELLKLATEKLDRIILVGGSTLMPIVKKRVREHYEEISGRAPEIRGFRPYECVAIGAAMYAARSQDTVSDDGIKWINGPGDIAQDIEMHPELWGVLNACNGPGWEIEVEIGSHKQRVELQPNGQFHIKPFILVPGENEVRLVVFDQHGLEFLRQTRTLKRGGFSIADPGLAHSIKLRLVDGMEELIPAGTCSGASARQTFYINDLTDTARAPLYEGHYPIAMVEFPTNAEPGTPVTFHTVYKQGRLIIQIQLGARASEEREVNLEILKTRERGTLARDFNELLQQTEFLLEHLPREGELSDYFRREWQALKLDIETEFANRIVLDLNRIEDRVCQLAMLHVHLQSYSSTAEGLRKQVKETRELIAAELDLLTELEKIEVEVTDDKQPDELAALATQLRELWRNYYQRHPPQIDGTLIDFTVRQLRKHLEAIKRDAADDKAALDEALDIEKKIDQIMKSEDYPAVFNRLSLFEAKHVNPLYQRVVISKNQQGLLRSTR